MIIYVITIFFLLVKSLVFLDQNFDFWFFVNFFFFQFSGQNQFSNFDFLVSREHEFQFSGENKSQNLSLKGNIFQFLGRENCPSYNAKRHCE